MLMCFSYTNKLYKRHAGNKKRGNSMVIFFPAVSSFKLICSKFKLIKFSF